MKHIFYSIIIIQLFICNTVNEQKRWQHFISNDIVNCIKRDGNNIWLGTKGGLVKCDFDGKELQVISKNDGLVDIDIRVIAFDKSGNKWVSTSGGLLLKYDGKSWTQFDSTNSPLKNDYVNSIVSNNNAVWFYTENRLLHKFENNNWQVSDKEINTRLEIKLIESSKNNLWTVTSKIYKGRGTSIYKFDGQTWKEHEIEQIGNYEDIFTGLTEDTIGNLCFASCIGIIKYENNTCNKIYFNPIFDIYSITSLSLGIDNQVLVYNDTDANLYKIVENKLVKLNKEKLPVIGLEDVIEIEKDVFILLSTDGKVYKMDAGVVKLFRDTHDDFWGNNVNNLVFSKLGNKYFSNQNSIFTLKNGKVNQMLKFDNDTYIVNLAIDKYDNLFVNTRDKVYKIDFNRNYTEILNLKDVNFIKNDNQGNIWCQTDKMLSKLNDTNWTHFPEIFTKWALEVDKQGRILVENKNSNLQIFDKGKSSEIQIYDNQYSEEESYINTIVLGKNDEIWVGTAAAGIIKIKGNKIKRYTYKNSALKYGFGNGAQALLIDKSSNLWCGNYDGLFKFNGKKWTHFNTQNSPLINNHVVDLKLDNEGNIWVATECGINVIYLDE